MHLKLKNRKKSGKNRKKGVLINFLIQISLDGPNQKKKKKKKKKENRRELTKNLHFLIFLFIACPR